jgi:uncharacterized protein
MWVRIVPFLIFAALTSLQGRLGESSRYWLYAAKVLLGAGSILLMWPWVREMRWKFSWEGILVGVLVFVIWVGLDRFYPKIGAGGGPIWNPHDYFGSDSAAAWFFIVVRLVGVTLVVPPLEEVFYRSFLYRYVVRPEFESVPLAHFSWRALLVTAGLFALAHPLEWLAALLCGLMYQALVLRKQRLGDAMTAHAITNLLLGLWVIVRGEWNFW